MKREDLRTKLVEAGIAEDKMGAVIDYIMSQNGVDVEAIKTTSEEKIKTLTTENKDLKSKVEEFKDYDDLKKFKEETVEKAESAKKTEFLKGQGCKHPELVIGNLDFTKATYDEEKKTYTGLEDDMKSLKEKYGELFQEEQQQQRMDPNPSSKSDTAFQDSYIKSHPEMAKYFTN